MMVNMSAELTPREIEVTELCAWGAAKKEIADMLCISESTVANHTRNIFRKTGCSKINELSAWWFCKTYHIPFSLSPIKRKIISIILFVIMIPQVWQYGNQFIRARTRIQTQSLRVVRGRSRRTDDTLTLINI